MKEFLEIATAKGTTTLHRREYCLERLVSRDIHQASSDHRRHRCIPCSPRAAIASWGGHGRMTETDTVDCHHPGGACNANSTSA
jgi:hypothetical protein